MFPFETERLRIEELSIKDADFVFALLNSPTWLKFIGDRNISDIEKAKAYIKDYYLEGYKKNGYGSYKIILKEVEKPIGMCGFYKRDYLDSVDIGYAILPQFEGKGFTSEAALMLLKYGQTQLNLNPIYAITSQKNLKSQHLLNKIGLIKKGTLKIEAETKEVLLYST